MTQSATQHDGRTDTESDANYPTGAETVDPDDEEVAARCPYCDRPFADVRSRNLHVGQRHDDVYSDAEREAYEEADQEEVDELFLLHIKAVVLIGLTWATFVVLYMVAIGSGIL